MRFIVDTHAWLWLQSEPERLPPSVLDVLEDPANDLFVSAASAWEIAVKHQRGRLPLPEPPMTYVPMRMADSGCKPLGVEHGHGLRAGQLPMHHRDPFDRLLIAQSQILDIPVVTKDSAFSLYEVDLVWS